MEMTEGIRYAGFWRRFAAFLIDSVILFLFFGPLLYGLYGADYFLWAREHNGLFSYYSVPELIITKVVPLIAVVLLWLRFGATPGKQLMHCRIVDARTGGALRPGQAVIRYFAYLVSMLPLYLGFLWIAWDKRKQGFHDKLAGTVVIYAPDRLENASLEDLMKESS
jgi:uncharacterized RDD family membrane protein YckC